ncbi:MAG: prepilin-type N-terminal cleavage/methylation domain-containing protein [Deltaproteobacteria bacterium]|nr:prepilin-type N-terminal cleavage/methylation domain-containing protein [Deltaproteobacteria bacterium]
MKRARARQGGFTMMELMIGLVISTLVVGLILSIGMRVSLAYRGQQQVAGVQQMLTAARAAIEADAKQAGMHISQGFTVANTGTQLHAPVQVIDSSTGPDQLALFYADPAAQAAIPTSASVATATSADFDNVAGFAAQDLVVLSTPDLISTQNPLAPGIDAPIATFAACALRISSIAGNRVSFVTAAPFGSASNNHCATPVKGKTMMYKLVARAYRIDPARQADGVLQVSATGQLSSASDWEDIGIGFVDLQVATRFFDNDNVDTPDVDTDPKREWYSGAMQQTLTATQAGPLVPPIEISISLVARTDRDVDGPGTASTPALRDAARPDHGSVGNRDAIALPSATDARLRGNRIYRWTTFGVDLRNMGVGR